MKALPLLGMIALSLSACAKDTTTYPSLAPRAVEKLGFAEPEVAVVEAKPDPALDARIAAFAQTLARTRQGFAEDARTAGAAAARARGKAVGSDAWLDAQTALAALDDWRAQTASLLSDVDLAASDRAAALEPVYPTLAELRGRVSEEVEGQSAAIDRLQATLPAA
ncbi:hypothetical protein NF700_03055 [Sphingomonadaceae bacterium OTU29MARTA1]|nr:hypothetical protein NF700_03055 [Sphingomonadaceae bacterium OTU29MARTA1]